MILRNADDTIKKNVNDNIKSLYGTLLDYDVETALSYSKWMIRKLNDTYNNTMQTKYNKDIREMKKVLDDSNRKQYDKLIRKRKKYMPKNYPNQLKRGDIVHVTYGHGYCDELSDGHYGIVLSNIIGSMYLIAPLTSSKPRGRILYYDDLKLPSKDKVVEKSYVLFNQIKFTHFRRLEYIDKVGLRHIEIDRVREILKIYNEIICEGIDSTTY